MKKIVILLTTLIILSFSGYGNTIDSNPDVKHDKVEQASSHVENIVMYSHSQTVNLGTTTPLFPPLNMKWEIGGPVFFMEYNVRFKPTESGTKMIIKCDLIKKQ